MDANCCESDAVEFRKMARRRPKSIEAKLAKKRKAEMERRARRKADEETRKEDQEKERLRYQARKKEGKIKMARDLTPEELLERRKRVREQVRRFRRRKRNLAVRTGNQTSQNVHPEPQQGRSPSEVGPDVKTSPQEPMGEDLQT